MRRAPRWRGRAAAAVALGASLLLAAGCSTDKLLDVTDIAVATPETVADSAALPNLINGVISMFQIGYSGAGDDAFLTSVADFTDEMRNSDTFNTRIATDQRAQLAPILGNTSDAAFTRLQQTRQAANLALASMAKYSPTDPQLPQVASLKGFSYVALAEGFCGYIPFSDFDANGGIVYGDPMTTQQVFDEAIKSFDVALAQNANYNLAKIGKARALLDQGHVAEAAAAVAGVPTNYVYLVEHSQNTGRQENPMYDLNISNRRYTVADKEGVNGLPFRSANDPRVPWRPSITGTNGFDRRTPLYDNLRYSSRSVGMPLATGVEARLIEAEAALAAGDVTTWLTRLNDLRASVGPLMSGMQSDWVLQLSLSKVTATTLAALTDPGAGLAADSAAKLRQNLTFSERAFWFYTTGHRLGELRRMVSNYGRAQASVFPNGTFAKGGTYGADVNFPIPFREQNNPKFDASKCVTTVP